MKIKIPFYILLFLSFAANAQLINWQFAKHIGGSGSDGCAKICNDKNGNTIFAGNSSSSSVTIDNLSFYNPAPSYPSSIILAKYDSTGNVMWAKNYPGSSGGYKAVNSVALDSADNILITGTFSGGSLVIDTITLLSKGYSDIFTAKFDPSGNVLWARNFGGWFYNYGMSITADVHNDVLLAGYFYSDTLKMDTITILNPNMGCFGDVIVAKLNSATGNVIWAKRAGGYGKDIANCIKTDKWGNVYVAGESQVSTPMNFDSINVSAAGFSGMFIAKYNNDGQVLWAKNAGGTFRDAFYDLAIDNYTGNVYTTGKYAGGAVFDSFTLPYLGNEDNAFLAQYDSLGNVVWAKEILSPQADVGTSLCLDNAGNLYAAGYSENLSATSMTDTIDTQSGLFLLKLDHNGNLLSSNSGIMAGIIRSASVSVDHHNNVCLAGNYFSKSLAIGQYSLTNYDTSPSGYTTDVFMTKYNNNGFVTSVKPLIIPLTYDVYPNPASNYFLISQLSDKATVSVIDMNGNVILDENTNDQHGVNIEHIKPGTYSVKVKDGSKTVYKKLVIVR